jgi:hypothetical protein
VFQTLNACCLAEEWQERGRFEWLAFIFDVMEFIGSFLFIAPILALADVWGRRITSNKLMVRAAGHCAVGGLASVVERRSVGRRGVLPRGRSRPFHPAALFPPRPTRPSHPSAPNTN